jgi:hypothetical protein
MHPLLALPADIIRLIFALLDLISLVRFLQINPIFYKRFRNELDYQRYLPSGFDWKEPLQYIRPYDLVRLLAVCKMVKTDRPARKPSRTEQTIYMTVRDVKLNPFAIGYWEVLRCFLERRGLFLFLSGSVGSLLLPQPVPCSSLGSGRRTFRRRANLIQFETIVNRLLFVVAVIIIPSIFLVSLRLAIAFPGVFPLTLMTRWPIGTAFLLSLWGFLLYLEYLFLCISFEWTPLGLEGIAEWFLFAVCLCLTLPSTLYYLFSYPLQNLILAVASLSIALLIALQSLPWSVKDILIAAVLVFFWRAVLLGVAVAVASTLFRKRCVDLVACGYRLKLF